MMLKKGNRIRDMHVATVAVAILGALLIAGWSAPASPESLETLTQAPAAVSQPTPTTLVSASPNAKATATTVQADQLMQVESVDPTVPIENIEVYLDSVALNANNMTWHLSAWNKNTSETDFQHFYRWDIYVTDELGNLYGMSSMSYTRYIGPKPGERLRFELVVPAAKAEAHSLTLHASAYVRTCVLGWCDYPISWENVTVDIPID
jgi:hypothetical protein